MAKLKLDLRKTLREIATGVQQGNVDRLLASQAVTGGGLAPRAQPAPAKTSSRRRVRLFGVRHALADLAGAVGVKTGAMLKDFARRGNQKIGRVSFKIVPSEAVRLRTFVFNKGDKNQAARPVLGMTGEQLDDASERVARESRDQFAAALKARN